ncbi:hypothetical protein J8281_01155 [Aquimarina sp. U1-2]|uniref:hypothetical protein n=1 Tax=Aquimarina sp. U1-2 TaxID=2823141 RepID=UPI001AEC92A4|nr:hypothetical protein [Aquimarina sp. U1-2]MBP2830780.1 hypothetical protein [Aquimarina sp. U1-2]
MKQQVIVFLSSLFFLNLMLTSCQDDDNTPETPTNQVTTATQYKDVETINSEINALVENVFNAESGFGRNPGASVNKVSNCVIINTEAVENTQSIVITFEDGCEINGEAISGQIRITFEVILNTASTIDMIYSLENVTYKDIAISGGATSTFSFESNTQNDSLTSNFGINSSLVFAWTNGLTATSESNLVNETFIVTNTDVPSDFEFYTLNSGTSRTTFSNGDVYAVEITTPLRNEKNCAYTVSGRVATSQNSETTTLDFGDGTCDNIATQINSDGTETTIEL